MLQPLISLKARMLCQGVNADEKAIELFRQQNPSGTKRGGLSSGGKMKLGGQLLVNAPVYRKREVGLKVVSSLNSESFCLKERERVLGLIEILPAPFWYQCQVGKFNITQIVTAHNRQLATAIYEDCALFNLGKQCQFCVINRSLIDKDPALVLKSADLLIRALAQIPVEEYGGLTINGGMTLTSGRGLELLEPVVKKVHEVYPNLPIAVEITPPLDLNWINRLAGAGISSLMMNLECWDQAIRAKLIPGKNQYCPRNSYLRAFKRALEVLGPGRVSTCFVVGIEPRESLEKGICEVAKMGVIPSPLAGRTFEDIPDYPFKPAVDWQEFLEVLQFAGRALRDLGLHTTDQAGCVACGMCDLVSFFMD